MRIFRSSLVAISILSTAMVALGASASQAGQGYLIKITNKWSATVEIEIINNTTNNWYMKDISTGLKIKAKESKVLYTEACENVFGCNQDMPSANEGGKELDFWILINRKPRDSVRIIYGFREGWFERLGSIALCKTGSWHVNEQPVDRPALPLKRRGDQFILNVTVAPDAGIVCTTE